MTPTQNEDTALPQLEIVRAATNDPALAKRTMKLGDREFAIVDLPYDDYLLFVAQAQPLIELLMGSLPGVKAAGLLDTLTPATLISYCATSLPEMARIVCSQTDAKITADDVKRLGKSPIALAMLVLAQVEQNGIIAEFRSFFQQMSPLLKALIPAKRPVQ